MVVWDSNTLKFKWYPISSEFAASEAKPVAAYWQRSDWLDLFDDNARQDPTEESGSIVGRGFLGGEELVKALGIHSTKRRAFLKLLERHRKTLGEDFQQVQNPRPNSPRFLYRADSPKILELAKAYRHPKPT